MAKKLVKFPKQQAATLKHLWLLVRGLSLDLPARDDELNKALDAAGKRAEAKQLTGTELAEYVDKECESEFESLSAYRDGIASRLRDAARLGERLGLTMDVCRELAIALAGGFDVPKPLSLKSRALVEIEKLQDRWGTVNEAKPKPKEKTGRKRKYTNEQARENHDRWNEFLIVYREPENKPPTGCPLRSTDHFLWWQHDRTSYQDVPESPEDVEALKRTYARYCRAKPARSRKGMTKRRR